MNSPLDRLRQVTKQANATDETRRLYANYVQSRRDNGWTDSDVSEYAASVKVLMGSDDQAALSLFPAGIYATASEARESAKSFWRDEA